MFNIHTPPTMTTHTKKKKEREREREEKHKVIELTALTNSQNNKETRKKINIYKKKEVWFFSFSLRRL